MGGMVGLEVIFCFSFFEGGDCLIQLKPISDGQNLQACYE